MRKRNYQLIIGLTITGFFLVLALVGQFWTPYSPTEMNAASVNVSPCLEHLLGTDNFGRDIFSRVMNGSGMTFLVALGTVVIGAVIGTVVGAFTGYFGGWIDEVVMRLNDMLLPWPRYGKCNFSFGYFVYSQLCPHCTQRNDPLQRTGLC